jgi:Predicted membrane protein (DUF2207) C-terminal domain/Predicted membrane protein (DUF2207) N-terminal domain
MAAASGDPAIPSYDSEVRIDPDGQLEVSEVWKLTGASGTFTRFVVSREHLPDDVDHVQEISDVEATVGDATKPTEVKTDGDITSIAIGDVSGDVELTLTYSVRGAVSSTVNGTEMHWSPLHGLPSEVQTTTVKLQTPETTHIQCTAGELNGSAPCTMAQIGETSSPEFQQFALAPGNTLRIVIGFKPDTVAANAIVEYRKSFGRSFTADGPRLGTALVVLAAGAAALFVLYRTRGRDKIDPRRVVPASLFSLGADTKIAFTPPENLRPGQVGTLIDERIDPVDVTASVFDLAVRGHLTVTELPKSSEFARPDWELRRLDGRDGLRPYEEGLLKALFGEADTVLVSKLGPQVRAHLGEVQNALYDDVVDRGWFAERPDKTRSKWGTLGIAVLVLGIALTVLLALTSRWGMLGLAVTLLGGGLIWLGRHMPSKTPAAGRVLGQMAAIRGELMEMDVSELPADQHTELCSRALPYAVVLGGADRWIDALVGTDLDDTPDEGFGWYRGPDNWHLHHLPDSLRNLTTNLTGALFAR